MIVMVEASHFTVDRARAALAAWDRYEPDISTARIVETANDLAETMRALLGAATASPAIGSSHRLDEQETPTPPSTKGTTR